VVPRSVVAVRYVLPFREGGSVPALMEADDAGTYVVKLRGAGQGPKVLVAELVAGELARAVGLDVPEIVFVDVDRAIADAERDPEIAEPLERSAGLNLGLDYLPGSVTFDPAVEPPVDALLASKIVLFDAFVANVDRTPRNPNLLSWHRRLWLIDHGAALYFHHGWGASAPLAGADDPFAEVKDHVLIRRASALHEAEAELRRTLTTEAFDRATRDIPTAWLDDAFPDRDAHRTAYAGWLAARLRNLSAVVEEVERARGV
jgi:HipA-like kinase